MHKCIKKDTLGQRIKAARLQMGLTQEQLAENLYIPKSTISAYENDKVDIKGSTLISLSEILNTTPDYLLGFTKTKNSFLANAERMLTLIEDEKAQKIILAQINAVVGLK